MIRLIRIVYNEPQELMVAFSHCQGSPNILSAGRTKRAASLCEERVRGARSSGAGTGTGGDRRTTGARERQSHRNQGLYILL